MDHAGGEGVWGEMFWAAVQSAAFVCDERDTLVEIGLTMIPPWSRIARVIRDVRYFVAHPNGNGVPRDGRHDPFGPGDTWGRAREQILHRFGHSHGCHAVQNHGFIVLGWLLGMDADGWFTIACDENRRVYAFLVGVGKERARFVMLGPEEATGYPAYVNIERCKVCGGGQPARCKCVLGY